MEIVRSGACFQQALTAQNGRPTTGCLSSTILAYPLTPPVSPLPNALWALLRVALSRRSLFEAKDESRKQAAESDKAKEAAVEEAVTRVKRQVEESMSETYR